eukprot:TRINITY_DN6181_c0_g1_i2.p1 TRINITY_DN6181_c0_g1~~TRINITY_DN6181_c0_g1_i2.p1  ORF type:complete len:1409 (+),score=349.19 TRINITY_DN6181_c0_g1_i2:379-4227(+)
MMVVILGHPGAGKTVLFDLLAGTRRGGNFTGELLINGKPRNEYFNRIAAYVTQRDIHMPTLTVRETFRFSALLRLSQSLSIEDKYARVEETIKLLNLKHCADTIVGNEMLRGVSGGEKKRVTIGVEAVLNRPMMFIDEPTTGLDAPAAFEVMRATRALADKGYTIISSVLQPGAELFSLFDTLLLLSQGESIYFGPSRDAVAYFRNLHIVCPPTKPIAEFLHEVTWSPEKYVADIETLQIELPVRQRRDLVVAYKSSEKYEALGKEMWKGIAPDEVVSKKSVFDDKYPISTYEQFLLCLRRGIMGLKRDRSVIRTRFVRSIILGLLIGSLFWDLSDSQTDAENRIGLLFFFLAFAGMGALQAIPPLLEERDVFYQQRNQYFFRTKAYFFAQTALELPLSFVEVFLFICIAYWMTGLTADAEKFFFCLGIMFGVKVTSNAFCRMVSAISPNLMVANALAPSGLALWFLMTGYLLPRESIPVFWIWMYWLSLFRYGLEGFAINELAGLEFRCQPEELLPPLGTPGFNNGQSCPISTGTNMLDRYDMGDSDSKKWFCFIMIWVFYVFFSMGTYFFLQYFRTDARGGNPKLRFKVKKRYSDVGRSNPSDDDGRVIKAPLPAPAIDQDPVPSTVVTIQGDRVPLLQSEVREIKATPHGAFVSFNDLKYSVDLPAVKVTLADKLPGGKFFMKKVPIERKMILKGVSGFVKPGMMVSLMGPSGAGKSTLLDVLAGRKTGGYIEGELLINGEKRNKFFTRLSGYCEQQDIHLETQTVRECVLFHAILRLPSDLTNQEKARAADATIDELGLRPFEDTVIGTPQTGLSPELRKRLSIAIELVHNPELIFLDEPTSGLDPLAAENVMKVIRQLASSGRAVICTIHQPSADLFQLFDWLLLLNQIGKQVYFGPVGPGARDVLGYFKELGATCEISKNPADFVLEVTGAGVGGQKYGDIDTVAAFRESKMFAEVQSTLANGSTLKPKVERPLPDSVYATGFLKQTAECLRRALTTYARRPVVRRAKNVRSVVMGIIIGTMFFQLKDDQQGARNRVSLLFFSILFAILSAVGSIPLIISDRNVYYRDRQAGAYRPSAYWLAQSIVELPFAFLSMMVFTVLMYFLCGMNTEGDRFTTFLIVYYLINVIAIIFCQFIAVISPGAEVANGAAPIALATFALFAGFLIPKGSIPDGWIWMFYASLFRYPLTALAINELQGLTFDCPDNEGAIPVLVPEPNGPTLKYFCPLTTGEQMLERFDMPTNESEKWDMFAQMWIFFAVLSLGTLLSLKYINYMRK